MEGSDPGELSHLLFFAVLDFRGFCFLSDNPALLLDHEEPVPQAWYTVPLKFGRNSKGTMNLEFRGNTYNVHRRATSSDAISWRCAKLSCVCNVTTRGSDRIRISSRPHNHPEVIPRTSSLGEALVVVKDEPADF